MSDNSMPSFYGDHSVVPIRQDITDLDAHFSRGRVLSQQLGMPLGVFLNVEKTECQCKNK